MLRRGAQLTVCLTVDALDGDNEIFELSRRAGRELLAYARELGAEAEIVTLSEQSAKAPELTVFADNMFSYSSDKYTPARDAIRLYRTESMAAECEQTAALCLEFVRDGGCRWRDIAVVARGDEQVRRSADFVIEVPVIAECLMPIVVSVPLQLLAYYIAVYKGRNVDQPRNLAKSVTVE